MKFTIKDNAAEIEVTEDTVEHDAEIRSALRRLPRYARRLGYRQITITFPAGILSAANESDEQG